MNNKNEIKNYKKYRYRENSSRKFEQEKVRGNGSRTPILISRISFRLRRYPDLRLIDIRKCILNDRLVYRIRMYSRN